MSKFLKFIDFTIRWVASNLAVPFWQIGHLYLSINYSTIYDMRVILSSFGMNILVAIGFWLEWKEQNKK